MILTDFNYYSDTKVNWLKTITTLNGNGNALNSIGLGSKITSLHVYNAIL